MNTERLSIGWDKKAGEGVNFGRMTGEGYDPVTHRQSIRTHSSQK